ncbi:MAG: hypothetical protein ACRC1J_02700, partial [Sandaracinobacteroides sp.]
MPARATFPRPRFWPVLLFWAVFLLWGQVAAAPLAAQQPAASPATLPPPSSQPSPGAPKSLLPDDFATPAQPATGTAEGPVPLEPGGPAPLTGFDPLAAPPVEAALLEVPEPDETDPLAELAGPTMDPARAGLLTRSQGGFRPDLFAGSDDRFLATLLGRLDAP